MSSVDSMQRRIDDQLMQLVKDNLEIHRADAVDVLLTASSVGLTRYANSEIIQNTVRDDVRAYVRVAAGSRHAGMATNRLDSEGLRAAGEGALEAALRTPEDADFPGLPTAEEVGKADPLLRWDSAAADATPMRRSDGIADILGAADKASVAGIFETGTHEFAVVSSNGVECFDGYTRCVMTCLATIEGATGWAEAQSHRIDALDASAVAARATAKAAAPRSPDRLEPGEFDVVLEASATADLLDYLAYAGFGAKQMLEGESFLSTKREQPVATEDITIVDDVAHPLSIGVAFDFEGVPTRRVEVIKDGVARSPVTDRRTARKLEVEPSGHFSGSNEFGPYAFHVVMEEGSGGSTEDLVAEVDDGILVTRFWYVNVLDRPETLLTGMTRDGTFRIRRGEVAEAIHNFRFAESVLDALAHTKQVGSDLHSFAPEFGIYGSTVAPSLHVGGFHFTSRTTH